MQARNVWIAALLTLGVLAVFAARSLQAADNYPDLVNRAGMQRMLSQQIAKAYLYKGQGIAAAETGNQIEIGAAKFERNEEELKTVKDSSVQEILVAVDAVFAKLKNIVTQPYKQEHAAAALELSEQLLAYAEDMTAKIETLSGEKADSIINMSGRQRMLSQRIAKHYIAYQAGFQDEDTAHKLEAAVSEFDAALKTLRSEKQNTNEIKKLLEKMQRSWDAVTPYFLKVRNKGNPFIVLSTTDDITKLADEVTSLYVKAVAK